jgi:hypothetical protein
MIGKQRNHPTSDDVNHLDRIMRETAEKTQRMVNEATEFKPGELTPEEEEFVKREGLNALNYIPQKILQKQSGAFLKHEEKMRKRAEIMSRSSTDPERVQMEREERAQNLRRGLDKRFNEFGYPMFLFFIVGFAYLIGDSYGLRMGIFSGLLMFVILELSYRLYARS